jgi:hypothetical protein
MFGLGLCKVLYMTIRLYFELDCEVKEPGRGYVKRIQDEV